MRFTLDGEPFDLTPELVRRRLAGHAPENVREYWVEVDGLRWPVKQVIAITTGADRTRFQSQASRRWLHRLGFPTGNGSTIDPPSRTTGSRRQAAFDASTLQALDVVDVRVTFAWRRAGAVTLDPAGLPVFPALPRAPGLYRYDFGVDAAGARTVYIGESVELARRASNYRNAKTDRSRQRTSRRIHREIVAHLSAGGSIEFAIATAARTGEGIDVDLRLKSARRLAENAAILVVRSWPSTRALNIDAELGEELE